MIYFLPSRISEKKINSIFAARIERIVTEQISTEWWWWWWRGGASCTTDIEETNS